MCVCVCVCVCMCVCVYVCVCRYISGLKVTTKFLGVILLLKVT